MNRSRLLMGIAAVFAGLFVLMAVLGFVYHFSLFVIAIPFGIVSYALWYHASGRLRAQVTRQAQEARREQHRRERETGGFGAGPRAEWTGPRNGFGGGSGAGFGSDGFGATTRNRRQNRRGRGGRHDRRGRMQSEPSLSDAEAYDVLGLDPGADPDRVRRAYREKVKDVHPDTEEGDEAAFKRVQKAYERLQNGHRR